MSEQDSKKASTPNKDRPKDRPWIFRTYSGHSTAKASNELYRTNLAKGQTGLSIAFDLPTQTGYDSDHVLARGEVGKVGVPISHLGDMVALFEGIPIEQMNTSMTINATAPWLLSLYIAAGEAQGADRAKLQGTTQNDIVKEYLSRGTYVFPPAPSMKLTTDIISFTYKEMPKWNPTNVCSYHLQEAGATPVQELSFALATAIAILDDVKASGQVPTEDFPRVVGRISFFVNAGLRFITEIARCVLLSIFGMTFARHDTGLKIQSCDVFVMGFRSIPLGSPNNSQKTMQRASCLRCWRSRFPKMHAPGRFSCLRGTRPLGCHAPGINNGRSGPSKSWPWKPTSWNMAISSTALML